MKLNKLNPSPVLDRALQARAQASTADVVSWLPPPTPRPQVPKCPRPSLCWAEGMKPQLLSVPQTPQILNWTLPPPQRSLSRSTSAPMEGSLLAPHQLKQLPPLSSEQAHWRRGSLTRKLPRDDPAVSGGLINSSCYFQCIKQGRRRAAAAPPTAQPSAVAASPCQEQAAAGLASST